MRNMQIFAITYRWMLFIPWLLKFLARGIENYEYNCL